MKSFTTILLFILSLQLFGQSTEKNSSKCLSFGISFSPDYAYRALNSDNKSDFVGLTNDYEFPRFGFTTGVITAYKISNKFSLESGLQFSDKGYKFKITHYDWVTPNSLIENQTNNDPLLPVEVLIQDHFYFLCVPVKGVYYITQNKLRFFISGGISTDFLVAAKEKSMITYKNTSTESKKNIAIEEFNRIEFTGLAGFGIEYKISKQINIQIEPEFRYSFTPLLPTTIVESGSTTIVLNSKKNLYSIGINFTVLF